VVDAAVLWEKVVVWGEPLVRLQDQDFPHWGIQEFLQ
jgi:hypothetical protein